MIRTRHRPGYRALKLLIALCTFIPRKVRGIKCESHISCKQGYISYDDLIMRYFLVRLVTPHSSTGNFETLSDWRFLLLFLGNTFTCGMKLCQAYYELVQTYFPSPNCMPRKICSSFQTTVFCVFNLLLSAIHLGMNRLAVWWLGHSSDISPYITKTALPNICHYEAIMKHFADSAPK